MNRCAWIAQMKKAGPAGAGLFHPLFPSYSSEWSSLFSDLWGIRVSPLDLFFALPIIDRIV